MKKTYLFYILLISLLINVWLGYEVFVKKENSVVQNSLPQDQYEFLSHRILTEYDRDLLIHFVPLRTQLREFIEGQYGNDFALYFEYLPTGTSVGVNDRTEFFPGSLLKTPTVMAYLHKQEEQGRGKSEEFSIEKKDIDKRFGSLWKRGVGSKITSDEAIRLALVESDNTAANIIHRNTREEDFDHVYEGLDVTLNFENDSNASITPKGYSSILKSLFFASILSKESSNYILDLLSKTPFNDKLRAGVPMEVKVSHKIGVYESLQVPIYSDCGIVYVPRRPYILCMASRSNEQVAKERMKTVSKLVYDFVAGTKGIGE